MLNFEAEINTCKIFMKKYKLGIVLSGGGAKAGAHCGALQAMKEYGIEPDVMAGTSAGSLISVLYSCGFSPKQMIEMSLDMNFFKDIVTPAIPRGGICESTPLLNHLRDTLPYKNFEELPIPVYVVASDMDHGKVKIFSKGEIAPRVVASCSIPVVFEPMVIGGVHYIDGGVFMNLPVPAIRNICDKVIAFSVRKVENEKYKGKLLYTATRAYSMMFMSNIMADAPLADNYVELDTGGFGVYEIEKMPELFKKGYEDACRAFEEMGYSRVLPPEHIEFPVRERIKKPRRL